MILHAIAYIINSQKNFCGVRLLDSVTGKSVDLSIRDLYDKLRTVEKVYNIELTGDMSNPVKWTNGKMDNYPCILNGDLYKKGGLVVIAKGNDKISLCNWKGNILGGSISDAMSAIRRFGIANGKILNDNIIPISGEYLSINSKNNSSKNGVTVVNKTQNNNSGKKYVWNRNNNNNSVSNSNRQKIKFNRGKVISSKGTGRNDSKTLTSNEDGAEMTVEQKILKAKLRVEKVAPFTYCLLNTIPMIETYELRTAGVTIDRYYYNPEHFRTISVRYITFVHIHECMHLYMQHRIREKGRIHKKWNIACDAYINSYIVYNFPEIVTSQEIIDHNNVWIDDIDLEKDTPEAIYDGLEGYDENGGSGQGNGGTGSGSDEEQSEGGGSGSYGNNDNDDSDEYSCGGGSGNTSEDESDGGNTEGNGGNGKDNGDKNGGYYYKGKKVENADKQDDNNDMIEDDKSESMSDESKSEASKRVIERAKVFNDVNKKGIGKGEGGLVREVEKVLAPRVDFRKLVRRRLNSKQQIEYDFSSPDRRFLSRNIILPGPHKSEDNALIDTYICIDTSGSISNRDLGIFFKILYDLFRVYKTEGEIMYWGSGVEATYKFDNYKELIKSKPVGGGGTDINCVFRYFEGKDFRTMRKNKPNLIIILTDGMFGNADTRYKKWSKETIWVIQPEYYDSFNPPFGTKAELKGVSDDKHRI